MRLLLMLFAALLVTSCGDSRGTGGLQMTSEGASFDTAVAAKHKAEHTIANAIGTEVGVTWRTGITISEEPNWSDLTEQWTWGPVTAAVVLAGSGTLSLSEADISASVSRYLVSHQRSGSPSPTVTVHIERQAPASPATAVIPAEGWRYTIKTGDTLANISSAFYGTPEHWRRICDANPGLRAEALQVDTVIFIPPAP